MIVPYLRLGETLLGLPHLPLKPVGLRDLIFGEHKRELLFGVGCAIFGWIITSPVLVVAISYILTPIFAALQRRYAICISQGYY